MGSQQERSPAEVPHEQEKRSLAEVLHDRHQEELDIVYTDLCRICNPNIR